MGIDFDEGVRKFMKVYSSLPSSEIELPIVVIDDKPISWKRAELEIEGKTELAKRIINELIEQNII